MSEFKVGDKVRVIVPLDTGPLSCKGVVAKVLRSEFHSGDQYLDVEVGGVAVNGCYASRFELVGYPNPPHKHAELIKAWADGAEIEYLNLVCWESVGVHPLWVEGTEYRIKPNKSAKDIKVEELEQKAQELADELNKLKGE